MTSLVNTSSKIVNKILNNFHVKMLISFYVFAFIIIVIMEIVGNTKKPGVKSCASGKCVGSTNEHTTAGDQTPPAKPATPPAKPATPPAKPATPPTASPPKVVKDSRATAKVIQNNLPRVDKQQKESNMDDMAFLSCCTNPHTKLLSTAMPYPFPEEKPPAHSSPDSRAKNSAETTKKDSVPKPYNAVTLGCNITVDEAKTM
tara:strand:+ start:9 stop:614 length:606 start_codon:yes stop_codon:yes gene_type:complete